MEHVSPREDSDDDPLYRAAVEVERDANLNAEMAEWETSTLGDRLEDRLDVRTMTG